MIEEIKNPLPTIQDFLDRKKQDIKNARRRKKRKKCKGNIKPNKYQAYFDLIKSNLPVCEVAFNHDTSIVEEFAEMEGISYTLSEACLIAFFEELKEQLMDGKITFIRKIGKFYLSGPHRNMYGEFSMPDMRCGVCPKLKPFFCIRDYDKIMLKNNKKELEEDEGGEDDT